MKKQYISPLMETIEIRVDGCLLDNSIVSTTGTGTGHELEIGGGTDGADSRYGGGWDDDY